METIITIALLALVFSVYGAVFYKFGYDARERKFQEGNITFTVGTENALWVGNARNGGKLQVRVYNPKLVEYLK